MQQAALPQHKTYGLTPANLKLSAASLKVVALAAGRHVVIEGPPGTGKSTLLRDIARQAGRQVVFAEGNAELTPARLIGQYDPAQVLTGGYVPGSFTDGPLLRAMRAGALLYLEEFNRVPEETLNVLITVLTEGRSRSRGWARCGRSRGSGWWPR